MWVEFVAEMSLIAAGKKPGAGGAAVRRGDVAAGAAESGSCERVDMWRRHIATAVNAEIGIAEVIGENYEDVRLIGGLRGTDNKPKD